MNSVARKIVLAVGALVVSVLITGDANAQDRISFHWNGSKITDGVPSPWRFRKWAPLIGLGGYEATARVEKQGGQNVVFLKAVKSGFLVGAKRQIDATQYRFATWRWKAQTLPRDGNFKRRATNDQALQVLFGFEGGHVLGYIWDSTGSPGASGSGLAFREDVRVIVLQAGPSKIGRWVTERRNLVEDYQRLFEEPPGTLEGVAVQSNSQHSGTTGAGWIGAITLTKN